MPVLSKSPLKTTFIIGAGASSEAGLPSGSVLKQTIADDLDIRFKLHGQQISGDPTIFLALKREAVGENPLSRRFDDFNRAAWRIRDAMPLAISIDNYIDAHSNDKLIERCGKLAIVRTILREESASSMFVDSTDSSPEIKFKLLEDTWYGNFMKLLTENCSLKDIDKRLASVALVIFNYDRCIEHYLYHALQRYYFISESDAAQLLQRMEIYHPYGTVGSLPWLDSNNAIEFGASPTPEQLKRLADQIKTFTEGTDASSSEIKSIRSRMWASNKLVFLGFAFHKLNLELLLPETSPHIKKANRFIIATAFGISKSSTVTITTELIDRCVIPRENILIRNDLKCNKLFNEYWFDLSLG